MTQPKLRTVRALDETRAECVAKIDAFLVELVGQFREDDVFALEAAHQMARRRLMDGLWARRQRLSAARAAAQEATRQITDHEATLVLTAR